jgi:hypothetical protein
MLIGQKGAGYQQPPYPPAPTLARPGTAGKIMVMRWRLANGYHIHHPYDLGSRSTYLYSAQELLTRGQV